MKCSILCSSKIFAPALYRIVSKINAIPVLIEMDEKESLVTLYDVMVDNIDTSDIIYIYNPTSNHTNEQFIHPIIFAAIMYAASVKQKDNNNLKIYFHEYPFPSIIGYDAIKQLINENLVEVYK